MRTELWDILYGKYYRTTQCYIVISWQNNYKHVLKKLQFMKLTKHKGIRRNLAWKFSLHENCKQRGVATNIRVPRIWTNWIFCKDHKQRSIYLWVIICSNIPGTFWLFYVFIMQVNGIQTPVKILKLPVHNMSRDQYVNIVGEGHVYLLTI